jgi:hypothetical protein
VKVTPGETVKVSCTYVPKHAQELPALQKLPPHSVAWGDGSSDEMCLGLMWEVPTTSHAKVDWAQPTGGLTLGKGNPDKGILAWEHPAGPASAAATVASITDG